MIKIHSQNQDILSPQLACVCTKFSQQNKERQLKILMDAVDSHIERCIEDYVFKILIETQVGDTTLNDADFRQSFRGFTPKERAKILTIKTVQNPRSSAASLAKI